MAIVHTLLGLLLLAAGASAAIPPGALPKLASLPATFTASGCTSLPLADARAVQSVWNLNTGAGTGVATAVAQAVAKCGTLGAQLTPGTTSPQKEQLTGAIMGCITPYAQVGAWRDRSRRK